MKYAQHYHKQDQKEADMTARKEQFSLVGVCLTYKAKEFSTCIQVAPILSFFIYMTTLATVLCFDLMFQISVRSRSPLFMVFLLLHFLKNAKILTAFARQVYST